MTPISLSRRSLLAGLAAALSGCGATVTGLGPIAGPPALADGAYVAADGTRLAYRRWLPPAGRPIRAVILALHGFNDYSASFALPAPFWAYRGIATYAYDQRGFGASGTRLLWPGREALASDADAVLRLVGAAHPGVPVFLLGESMGGAVALAALAAQPDLPVAGLMLVAPAVWRRDDIPFPGALLLDLMAFAMPYNRMTPPDGFRVQPSDNAAVLSGLRDDPLVLKETRADSLQGLVDLMDAAAGGPMPRPDLPVLLLYGLRDELVPFEAVLRLSDRLAGGRAEFRRVFYDRGYHLLLRDHQAARVWRDVAAWIADPGGLLPSEAQNRP
ncbi:alpha/beta fold hydrolase [Zavarzinia sp.]|uniref:alpha/beta fold hydrolase n=1 Tax=Zavarzinia sp. TaxID=2027920 RepID=UPI0035623883